MFCGLLTGCQQAWNWQAGRAGPNFKRTYKITNKINGSNYIGVNMYPEPLVSAEEAGSTLLSMSPSLTCQGKELTSARHAAAYPRHLPKCQGLKTQWLESTGND